MDPVHTCIVDRPGREKRASPPRRILGPGPPSTPLLRHFLAKLVSFRVPGMLNKLKWETTSASRLLSFATCQTEAAFHLSSKLRFASYPLLPLDSSVFYPLCPFYCFYRFLRDSSACLGNLYLVHLFLHFVHGKTSNRTALFFPQFDTTSLCVLITDETRLHSHDAAIRPFPSYYCVAC